MLESNHQAGRYRRYGGPIPGHGRKILQATTTNRAAVRQRALVDAQTRVEACIAERRTR